MILRIGAHALPLASLGLGRAAAQTPARQLLDQYLAQAALTEPAYRTDLKAGGPAPGRDAGFSAYLGSFTYRPRTYAELSAPERSDLLQDPALRTFLADHAASRPAAGSQFSIDPAEMLQRRPLVVVLPP